MDEHSLRSSNPSKASRIALLSWLGVGVILASISMIAFISNAREKGFSLVRHRRVVR